MPFALAHKDTSPELNHYTKFHVLKPKQLCERSSETAFAWTQAGILCALQSIQLAAPRALTAYSARYKCTTHVQVRSTVSPHHNSGAQRHVLPEQRGDIDLPTEEGISPTAAVAMSSHPLGDLQMLVPLSCCLPWWKCNGGECPGESTKVLGVQHWAKFMCHNLSISVLKAGLTSHMAP